MKINTLIFDGSIFLDKLQCFETNQIKWCVVVFSSINKFFIDLKCLIIFNAISIIAWLTRFVKTDSSNLELSETFRIWYFQQANLIYATDFNRNRTTFLIISWVTIVETLKTSPVLLFCYILYLRSSSVSWTSRILWLFLLKHTQ